MSRSFASRVLVFAAATLATLGTIVAMAQTLRDSSTAVVFNAASTTLTIVLDGDETFLLRPSSGPGQRPTIEPVTITYVKLPKDGPKPPPPPPPPSPLSPRAKAIQAAAASVVDATRATTAAALATAYSEVAARVRAGALTGSETILADARTSADKVLGAKASAWRAVRDVLTEQWTAAEQEGANDDEFAKLLDDVVAGLRGAK